MLVSRAAVLGGLMAVIASGGLRAQTAPPYVPKQSDRPSPAEGDEAGFVPIFDGQTLQGWEGDRTYWRVENGALVGEITPATIVKSNTFIIWRGGRPKDFELKLEYRITPVGNSGVNYRSASVPDPVTPANAFALRGYQFDIDGPKRYIGQNYEEKGRLFLAMRGQIARVVGGRPPIVVASVGDDAQLASLATDDWNTVHLIVRGNTLMHLLNGRLLSVTIDDDAPNRPAEGLIGMQVHVGPPMKVEYRNIRLKTW
jgi:putative transposon-encoded protein